MRARTLFALSLVLVCTIAGTAWAAPVTAKRLRHATGDTYLVDGHYLRGEARLTAMRDSGDLPDTIPNGRCSFQLAGDPSVAYYVRSCP